MTEPRVELDSLETSALLLRMSALAAAVGPPTAREELPAPTTLGEYAVIGQLGAGGMGEVLQVWDADLRRTMAAKMIRGAPDDDRLQRFVAEAQITAQLEHPNIVPLHRLALTDAGQPYFTMKQVEGVDLAALVADASPNGGRRSTFELLRIVLDICDAVSFAHSRGVVHRDLKPANVMVGGYGEVLVCDWGLATALGADGLAPPGAVGTPGYAAPEQARGDPIDVRADVHALGGLLYHVIAGRPPRRDARGSLKAVAVGGAAIPRELRAIVHRATAPDRDDRYPDVRALTDDIRAFLEHREVSAARYSLGQRAGKLARRHRALAAAVALVVIGGSIAGALTLHQRRERVRAERVAVTNLAARTGTIVRAALALRRRGLVDDARALLPELQRASAATARELPQLAEPHYQLGRLYRALQDHDAAAACQARALALVPDHAAARYEQLVLRLHAYRREHLDAYRRLAFEPSVGQGPRALLADDLAHLLRTPRLADARLRCARGLAAWVDGDPADALAHLEAALAARPDLVEATQAAAMIEIEDQRPSAAIDRLDRALERDSGYLPFYALRVEATIDAAEDTAALDRRLALTDSAHGVAVRMHRLDAQRGAFYLGWAALGRAHVWWVSGAHDRASAGLDEAVAALREATAADAGNAQAWLCLGVALRDRAALAGPGTGDPREAFAPALDALARCGDSDPAMVAIERGGVYQYIGQHARDADQARAALRQALATYDRAPAPLPPSAARQLARARATALAHLARREPDRAAEHLARAEPHVASAGSPRARLIWHEARIATAADKPAARADLIAWATALDADARAALGVGGSVVSAYKATAEAAARASADTDSAAGPASAATALDAAQRWLDAWPERLRGVDWLRARASLITARANVAIRLGADARGPLDAAIAAANAWRAADPRAVEAIALRARLRVGLGRQHWRRGEGELAHAAWRAALADRQELCRREPDRAARWLDLGKLHCRIATGLPAGQRLAPYRTAIAPLDRAIALGAGAAAYHYRGRARMTLAAYDPQRAPQLLRQAIDDLTRALDPSAGADRSSGARRDLAGALVNLASHLQNDQPDRADEAPALLARAIRELDRVIAARPTDVDARFYRGNARLNQSRHQRGDARRATLEAAIADYREAQRLAPDHTGPIDRNLARARKLLAAMGPR